MRTNKLFSILAIVTMITSTVAYGQNEKNRVALKGSAVMVSDNATDWGLEVGGKLVVAKNYTHFKTPDGKFFAGEAKDGKMGVCDDTGKFLFPCKYFKTNISASTISIIETSGAKPKFYNTSNPTVEVIAKEMTAKSLEEQVANSSTKGTYFNPSSAKQVRASEQSQAASAAAPEGAFSFQTNSKNKQELIIDDQIVYTADNFNLITTPKFYKESTCWLFVVENNPTGIKEYKGLLGVQIMEKDGKRVVEHEILIPIEYYFIDFEQGSEYWLRCSQYGGGRKILSIWGLTKEEYKKKYSKFYDVDATCTADSRLKIKQVIVGSNMTEVAMEFTQTGESDYFTLEPTGGYQDGLRYYIEVNGTKYPLRRFSDDIDRWGKKHVATGKTLSFMLIFDKIPDEITQLDLIEGTQGTRHFKNITLKEQK